VRGSSPFTQAEDREWVPAGVVAQKTTLWWFDLSWGLLSCDPFVADPVLLFHKLPEDRAQPNNARPDPDVHIHLVADLAQNPLMSLLLHHGLTLHEIINLLQKS
jgi:hypothetical protein